MVTARREIEENIKLVDIILLVLDARAPFSCRNPQLENMLQNKKVLYIFNKSDLADPEQTRKYILQFQQQGLVAVAMEAISGGGRKEVLKQVQLMYQELAARMLEKGRRVRPARLMVAGVPNVGKSTVLNVLAGKKSARTGEKPGVTRGKQWVRYAEQLEIMDTPGLMWPKVESEAQGYKLALLNIVGSKAYQEYDVILFLLAELRLFNPQILQDKIHHDALNYSNEELLSELAKRRGYLQHGGAVDHEKTAQVILHEFRKGKWGRFSMD